MVATRRKERPHPKRGTAKVFFDNPLKLARLFTNPNRLNYQETKWYDGKRGLKAIEHFMEDIHNRLECWSYAGKTVYMATSRFWYDFTLTEVDGVKIIECTRYCNNTWRRWDTWMNVHSCTVGKEWLMQEPQKSKWIPLFREG